MNGKDLLIFLDYTYEGNWFEIYGAIKNKIFFKPKEIEQVSKQVQEEYEVITMLDAEYPEEYKKQPNPPFVLKTKK